MSVSLCWLAHLSFPALAAHLCVYRGVCPSVVFGTLSWNFQVVLSSTALEILGASESLVGKAFIYKQTLSMFTFSTQQN